MIQWKARLSKPMCVSFGAVRAIRGKNFDLAEGNDFWLEFERKIRKILGSRNRLRFHFVQPALIFMLGWSRHFLGFAILVFMHMSGDQLDVFLDICLVFLSCLLLIRKFEF